MNYIKVNYGGIINFLDNYDIFRISNKNKKIYVELYEEFLNDWLLV